jgi:protein TonB
MNRKVLVPIVWGVLSLGIHIAFLTMCPGPDPVTCKSPTFLEVGLLEISGQPEKKAGSAVKDHPDRLDHRAKRNVKSALRSSHETKTSVQYSKSKLKSPLEVSLTSKQMPGPKPENFEERAELSEHAISQRTEMSEKPVLLDSSVKKGGLLPQTSSLKRGKDTVAKEVGSAGALLVEAVPAYAENPPPPYPRIARKRGWEGEVLLWVQVSDIGRVLDARLERSSGHKVLDRTALEAVRRWRFTPARLGATPIEGEVRIPIRFELRRE